MTSVEGFEDAIRKFVCHVICITYQVCDNSSATCPIFNMITIDILFGQTIDESVLLHNTGEKEILDRKEGGRQNLASSILQGIV